MYTYIIVYVRCLKRKHSAETIIIRHRDISVELLDIYLFSFVVSKKLLTIPRDFVLKYKRITHFGNSARRTARSSEDNTDDVLRV